jgi:hypothetical protein
MPLRLKMIAAGVDMIDAAFDRFAQHGDRGLLVLRRTEDARASELHGAIAQAIHAAMAKQKRSCGFF